MMLYHDTVTLFVPVDMDGFDVIWHRFTLKNVTIETAVGEDGDTGTLYIFYDRAKFYSCGKRIPPFRINEGAAVIRGSHASADEFTVKLPPRGVMRVVGAKHFIRGNMSVHHTRLTLK